MGDREVYLKRVMEVITNNPTAGELDELLEAFGRVGFIAAEAEGLAEQAEATRKHKEAEAYLHAKTSAPPGEKVTERQAEAQAEIAIKEYRDAEVEARTKSRKLRNLLSAIEQVINGVKFLSRVAG